MPDEHPRAETRGTLLVTGATGRQGGATARRLLRDGWRVRVLVRDPASPAARELAAAGAEPHRGDLDDPGGLEAAMAGAHGVFAVTPDDLDGKREIRRGRNLADAAAAAGIGHLVFASVGGAERGTGIPYWETKWVIEQHIAALGLPATVLRPVRFMENHTTPGLPLGGISPDGVLRHLFPADAPVQLVAVTDIGAFAALAFADPETYLGQALELAGDELTPDATVRLISRHVGRQITYRQVTDEESGLPGDVARAITDPRGIWHADLSDLRRRHPAMLDLPAWLEQGGTAAITTLLDTQDPEADHVR
ncbi:NmrA/HSCARG family protein [Actinomadura sp. KC345]|uniref:NmrA/HSCARG family protein n=1 Tax=Actinomadura sp. KC345 TaxID=2530371 RepID=UPI00104441FE|nr:NmrA/HSCARG family protein [Actinomadura sp. KC345]TDC55113.1 NmrA/HSCARG family protein [Actinomadura sp. KC345]